MFSQTNISNLGTFLVWMAKKVIRGWLCEGENKNDKNRNRVLKKNKGNLVAIFLKSKLLNNSLKYVYWETLQDNWQSEERWKDLITNIFHLFMKVV